jgi:hypothetical protein
MLLIESIELHQKASLPQTPVKLTPPPQLTSKLQHLSHLLSHQLQFGHRVQMKALPTLPTHLRTHYTRLVHRFNSVKGWLIAGLGLALLWVWLWQWLLSLAVGSTVMVGVYLAQQKQLKLPTVWLEHWHKLWNRSNRSLSLSVLAGLLALSVTFWATAVWAESEQHWLASGLILEGFGILALFGLLWQLLRSQATPADVFYRQSLDNLSHPDPLKRLIAIRGLTQGATNPSFPITATHLADCFRLMLDRETESLVCSALLDGIQRLNIQRLSPARQLEGGTGPVQFKRTPQPATHPEDSD